MVALQIGNLGNLYKGTYLSILDSIIQKFLTLDNFTENSTVWLTVIYCTVFQSQWGWVYLDPYENVNFRLIWLLTQLLPCELTQLCVCSPFLLCMYILCVAFAWPQHLQLFIFTVFIFSVAYDRSANKPTISNNCCYL